MNPKNHHFSLGKLFATLWLFLGWFAQVIPLSAFTAQAEWKFQTLQNSSSEWWQTLSIKTVPGVVYHLQKSNTLAAGDWTNVASTYGSGSEWLCRQVLGPPVVDSGSRSSPITSRVVSLAQQRAIATMQVHHGPPQRGQRMAQRPRPVLRREVLLQPLSLGIRCPGAETGWRDVLAFHESSSGILYSSNSVSAAVARMSRVMPASSAMAFLCARPEADAVVKILRMAQ